MIGVIRGLQPGIQTVVCSDYLKGVLSPRVLGETFAAAERLGVRSIVAPKDSHAQKYFGADILMPNARELAQLSEPKSAESSLEDRASSLVDKLALQALVVTRGGEGMSLFENFSAGLRRVDIPTTARSVYDVTGAGTRPSPHLPRRWLVVLASKLLQTSLISRRVLKSENEVLRALPWMRFVLCTQNKVVSR